MLRQQGRIKATMLWDSVGFETPFIISNRANVCLEVRIHGKLEHLKFYASLRLVVLYKISHRALE